MILYKQSDKVTGTRILSEFKSFWIQDEHT